MKASTNELIKHSATIHVSNSLSLLERKIYNILLKNAFHDLLRRDCYRIKLNELKRNLGREGNTDNEVKEAIEKLVGTRLKWNIFDKDSQNEWGVTTVLAAATIEKGVCSYEYSSKLKMFLAKPNVYARLNLLVQREFRSKHALALWEFLIDKLCTSKKDDLVTEWITLDSYRLLLNIEGQYSDFKVLNRDAVKRPIEEINKVSDIEVTVNYKKEKKKIAALAFSVKRKANFQFSLPLATIEEDPLAQQQREMEEKKQQLTEMLKNEFKLSLKSIKKFLDSYTMEEIFSSINYVRTQIKAIRIDNIAAYTKAAIENGWQEDAAIIAATTSKIKGEEEKLPQEWQEIRTRLKKKLGEAAFNSWIKDIIFKKNDAEGIVCLLAPNKLKKDRLESNYLPTILSCWQEVDEKIKKIEIRAAK